MFLQNMDNKRKRECEDKSYSKKQKTEPEIKMNLLEENEQVCAFIHYAADLYYSCCLQTNKMHLQQTNEMHLLVTTQNLPG